MTHAATPLSARNRPSSQPLVTSRHRGGTVRDVTEAATPQRIVPMEIESLLSALMAHEPAAELRAGADRLEVAITAEGDVPTAAREDLNSAIELVRGDQPCAAASALLAARAALAPRA